MTGFKPPYGRVPEVEVFNLDHYCHEGPLARSVADCALLQNVIAGPHPSDVASLRPKLEIPGRLEPVTGMRIALSVDLGCYEVDDDVAANTRAAADRLRDAGATVQEVPLPWQLETINRAARIHFGMIFGPSVRDIYDKHAEELTSYARRFVAESDQVTKADYVAGLALEAAIYAPLGELLEEFDALICPTFAVPALPAEYDTDQPVAGERPAARGLARRADDPAVQHREPVPGAEHPVRAVTRRGAHRAVGRRPDLRRRHRVPGRRRARGALRVAGRARATPAAVNPGSTGWPAAPGGAVTSR